MNSYIGFSLSTLKMPILGNLIQLLQKGRYSHSFVAVYVKSRGLYVIDATAHGVRVRTMEMFLKENRVVKKYYIEKCSDEMSYNMLFWGLEKSGLKYPKLEILGNLIQLLTWRLFKKVIKNPFGMGQNYPRCNELCAMALKEFTGIEIDRDLDSIDLIYLDEFLEKHLEN